MVFSENESASRFVAFTIDHKRVAVETITCILRYTSLVTAILNPYQQDLQSETVM